MRAFVDLRNFYEITCNDANLEQELFSDFIEKSQENLQAMRASIDTMDKTAWKENAHMMKGACKSLGAFPLAELMEQAEKCAPDDKSELYRKIVNSFDEVKKFLEKEATSRNL